MSFRSFEPSDRLSAIGRFSNGQITETERKCLEIQSPEDLAKSKYDLPVEYHPKLLDEFTRRQPMQAKVQRGLQSIKLEKHGTFAKYILSQKTSIMFLCESMKPTRKSRFEFVKPEVLIDALEARPKFYAFRKMAIELLRTKTLLQLQILGENETCPSTAQIPQRVFSWSADDYYARRSINNMVWLEVYERDFRHCIEMHKFKFDLEELAKYLDLIMCGALCEDTSFSFDSEVIQLLEDASDLLSAYDRLSTELKENRIACAELKSQHGAVTSKASEMEEHVRANIVQQMADASVFYPIMYRYQKGWYTAQADQVETKIDKDLTKHREEIADWINKIQEETSAMQNSLNMYYTEIEYFKTKINEYTTKFETEYDDLENAISYKKLSMIKIEQQREHLTNQMQEFRSALVEHRLKTLAEEEEKRRLMKEAAERELLKLAKAEAKKQKKAENLKDDKNKKKRKK